MYVCGRGHGNNYSCDYFYGFMGSLFRSVRFSAEKSLIVDRFNCFFFFYLFRIAQSLRAHRRNVSINFIATTRLDASLVIFTLCYYYIFSDVVVGRSIPIISCNITRKRSRIIIIKHYCGIRISIPRMENVL